MWMCVCVCVGGGGCMATADNGYRNEGRQSMPDQTQSHLQLQIRSKLPLLTPSRDDKHLNGLRSREKGRKEERRKGRRRGRREREREREWMRNRMNESPFINSKKKQMQERTTGLGGLITLRRNNGGRRKRKLALWANRKQWD